MGLTTSRSDPLIEVILHKGCVMSDPYLTQGTCKITLASNLCGNYVKKLRNHYIINQHANSHKSGPPDGKGSKARNLERTAYHIGKELARSPYMNRSLEIYLTLRRYQGDIPSTDLMRPRD